MGPSLQLQSPARIWPGGGREEAVSVRTVTTDLPDEDKAVSHLPLLEDL